MTWKSHNLGLLNRPALPCHNENAAGRLYAYAERNSVLRGLGFECYADYLASETWGRIRRKVLKKYPKCQVCLSDEAEQVHHKDYSKNTMLGLNPSSLLAVCGVCHTIAEFDTNGRKTSLDDANKRIVSFQRSGAVKPFAKRPGIGQKSCKCGRLIKIKYPLCKACTRGLQKFPRIKTIHPHQRFCIDCGNMPKSFSNRCRFCLRIYEASIKKTIDPNNGFHSQPAAPSSIEKPEVQKPSQPRNAPTHPGGAARPVQAPAPNNKPMQCPTPDNMVSDTALV